MHGIGLRIGLAMSKEMVYIYIYIYILYIYIYGVGLGVYLENTGPVTRVPPAACFVLPGAPRRPA